MTRREALCSAMSKIAWCYVFLHFDVKLGSIDVLPAWLGYLWVLRALPVLEQEETTARLLKPLAKLLLGWCLVEWILMCFGAPLNVPVAAAMIGAVSLYFHFQLLTNVAEILAWYGYSAHDAILRQRNVRTVITTVMAFQAVWQSLEAVLLIMAAVYLLAMFLLFVELFRAKGYLAEAPEEVFGVRS